jgi:hypothetical protein
VSQAHLESEVPVDVRGPVILSSTTDLAGRTSPYALIRQPSMPLGNLSPFGDNVSPNGYTGHGLR